MPETHRNAENIRKAYSNIINYELNRSMKKLTALTIIMTIPTMIFSFYGMNTILPGAGSASGWGTPPLTRPPAR